MARQPPPPVMHPPGSTGRPSDPRHEPSDIESGTVVRWMIGLVVATGLILAAVTVLFVAFLGHLPTVTIPPPGMAGAAATPTVLPPEPRLESGPGQTAAFVRAREDPVLNSYGWVDQKNGVARIPIDRAMQIIAQQGLPARPATTPTATDEGLTRPSYASSGRYPEVVLH